MMNKTALALGTFDGVHLGHRAVIEAAVKSGFKPVVVAFKYPPKMYFDKSVGYITSIEDKNRAFKALGVDSIQYLDFLSIRNMSSEEFLTFLKEKYNPAFICCGFNYHFGKNGAGNTSLLQEFCKQNDITLKVLEPVCEDNKTISSTYIRGLLKNGEVEKANRLLSIDFGFSGAVIKGDERGRTIGYPTANQNYPNNLTEIKHGVYKSLITVNGKTYNAITNIGHRPTFKTDNVGAETYIIDFYDDIYGEIADIRLAQFLRVDQKFNSIEALKEAIKKDIEQ